MASGSEPARGCAGLRAAALLALLVAAFGCHSAPEPTGPATSYPAIAFRRSGDPVEVVQLAAVAYTSHAKRVNARYAGDEPARLSGRAMDTSAIMHPFPDGRPARVDIGLARRYRLFTALFGIEDCAQSLGTVQATIYLDGEPALTTGVLRPMDRPVALRIDLRGRSRIEIVVADAGDGTNSDHGLLGNPLLYPVHAEPVSFITPPL
ncbi:MAG: NPCBM/NEW2 domain-containing protein, partial [Candidatus Hydrogenedentes bacterium]|nr:NPCBM/NEW2 domain-containing protein [Candidatus Hydrogenedentota bacterium]